MFALLHSLTMFFINFFKSPRRLEAENLFLRHQLSIALRRAPPRLRLRGSDRALLVWITRLWPSLIGAAQVVYVFGAEPRPAATAVVRGDTTPDGRVAGATDHRGLSLGISSRLVLPENHIRA